MRIKLLFVLFITSCSVFALEPERYNWKVGVNKYGCNIQLDSRVYEDNPSTYSSSVGFYFTFFKKRPNVSHIDLDFYGDNQDRLLHMIQVLPSFDSSDSKIFVDSVSVYLNEQDYIFEKGKNFDPTFPQFILTPDSVEKIWKALVNGSDVEYLFSYNDKSELRFKSQGENFPIFANMFLNCIESSKAVPNKKINKDT